MKVALYDLTTGEEGMKLLNRIKYWFYVRKFHVEEIRIEDADNSVNVLVKVNGKIYILDTIYSLSGNSSGHTDYGIAKIADRN